MATTRRTSEAHKLVGQLQLARIQLTKAESTLEASKEQWRQAKRRRKEAKLAARRARKEVKCAKVELAEAIEAVAQVEAKLADANKQQVRRQMNAQRAARTRIPESQVQKVQTPMRGPGRVPTAHPKPVGSEPAATLPATQPPTTAVPDIPEAAARPLFESAAP